jgi:hypothetical protein
METLLTLDHTHPRTQDGALQLQHIPLLLCQAMARIATTEGAEGICDEEGIGNSEEQATPSIGDGESLALQLASNDSQERYRNWTRIPNLATIVTVKSRTVTRAPLPDQTSAPHCVRVTTHLLVKS